MGILIPKDFLIEVKKGNVNGHEIVNKFGWAEDIDTGAAFAVWDGKTAGGSYPDADYTWPSDTAATYYVASSNAGDTQSYEFIGTDGDFKQQTVTMAATGQTPKAITSSGGSETWTRMFRIKNVGSTNNAGIIFVTSEDNHTSGVPDDSAKIVAMISIGNNQTLMALYTVPAGKAAILLRAYYGCGKGEDFKLSLLARPTGQVFQINDRQFSYEKHVPNEFRAGHKFDAKTDIIVKAESVTTANREIAAGFDLLVYDA